MKSINFRSTLLVRFDLSLVEVPNAHFMHTAVVNVSRQSTFRHEFVMPLSMTTGGVCPLTRSLAWFIRSSSNHTHVFRRSSNHICVFAYLRILLDV